MSERIWMTFFAHTDEDAVEFLLALLPPTTRPAEAIFRETALGLSDKRRLSSGQVAGDSNGQ